MVNYPNYKQSFAQQANHLSCEGEALRTLI
ncbi:hypothetical protein N781_15125 [Pontibacillus halophilus JSM 076056 = DSM 19796]|uniref:Uncharacterized protein n=1 Tax=Pontibacillus halophilus JSM 076056 = DSM 19796 TaxID=1385510 RepID=A0A0A5GLA3_9BACI|nr:hypothetical protein N781_15125 [Pontibacillus halophilus JSM 076056 = DSM 19796]